MEQGPSVSAGLKLAPAGGGWTSLRPMCDELNSTICLLKTGDWPTTSICAYRALSAAGLGRGRLVYSIIKKLGRENKEDFLELLT
jgi:hypothetical protein